MRVFWPSNCLDTSSIGQHLLLLGWRNGEDDIVVVRAVPYLNLDLMSRLLEGDGLLVRNFEDEQKSFIQTAFRTTLLSSQKKRSLPKSTCESSSRLYARLNDNRIQIVGSTSFNDLHSLRAQYACREQLGGDLLKFIFLQNAGEQFEIKEESNASCLIIKFDPPDPKRMHYFTLNKANLYGHSQDTDPNEHQKLKDLAFHSSPAGQKSDWWDAIIAELNCVHDLQITITLNLDRLFLNIEAEPEKYKYALVSPPQIQEKRPGRTRSKSFVQPRLRLVQLLMMIRSVIEVGLQLLESVIFDETKLISLFCTAQQLDLRLNQFCYLPHEYIAITKRSQQDWHWLTPHRNESYIRFNNYLWLGTNDLIFGGYFFTLIDAHADYLALAIRQAVDFLCLKFVDVTHWLMAWPAGFKLNTQLAQFMGDVTIWIIWAWHSLLSTVLSDRISRSVIRIIAISGFLGGATIQISLVIDLFTFMSFHLFLLYRIFARVYYQQYSVLLSLFRVFRGLKFNVLRNRVDHGDHDVHQLLLGTILFTVVLFLLPTVFAFYIVFTMVRLTALAVVSLLCVALAFLNHFPLFPLLLRIKSPRRVPSGINFELIRNTNGSNQLLMSTKSMQPSEIFSQYTDTMRQFSDGLLNFKVVEELCTGEFVHFQQSKLYASLYSMLPSRRKPAGILYLEICEYLDVKSSSI